MSFPGRGVRVLAADANSCGSKAGQYSGMKKPDTESRLYPADVLWWAHQDSNLGPAGYEPAALPTEL